MAWWIVGTAHLGNDHPHRAPHAAQPPAGRRGSDVSGRASTDGEVDHADSVA